MYQVRELLSNAKDCIEGAIEGLMDPETGDSLHPAMSARLQAIVLQLENCETEADSPNKQESEMQD